MQGASNLGEVVLLWIWFRMDLTQNITWEYKNLHLDIPTNYHNLTGIIVMLPTPKFFDIIIDVDYVMLQVWSLPWFSNLIMSFQTHRCLLFPLLFHYKISYILMWLPKTMTPHKAHMLGLNQKRTCPLQPSVATCPL